MTSSVRVLVLIVAASILGPQTQAPAKLSLRDALQAKFEESRTGLNRKCNFRVACGPTGLLD
jgi:hypothetical protein